MIATADKNFRLAFELLERNGLLLVWGKEIPDVGGVVAATRKGSWWSSPLAQEIFDINERLSDHPDVTVTKLVAGKVTFVHRKLWRKLVALGKAREDWQMKKLSQAARLLLNELDKEGILYTNSLPRSLGPKPGDIARELELKLLLHSEQIHTESGKHGKILETWTAWTKRVGFKALPLNPETARHFFEKRVNEIRDPYWGDNLLPWR